MKKLLALRSSVYFAILIEIILGVLFSTLSVVAFYFVTAALLQHQFDQLDIDLSLAVYSFRSPMMTTFMTVVTTFGYEIMVGLAIGIFIRMLVKKRFSEAALFSVVVVVGAIVNRLVKELLARPRPSIDPLIIVNPSYSFPSGHAMNTMIFFSLLVYLVYRFTRNKSWTVVMFVIAVVMIFLVGLSRVYLGVHYPSDVLAGYIAGFGVFATAVTVERTISYVITRGRNPLSGKPTSA